MNLYRLPVFALLLGALACGGDSATGVSRSQSSQVQTGFVVRTMVDNGTTYGYQVFVPAGYTSAQKWPMILFLHGGVESGTDNVKQVTVGLGPVVRAQAATFPAIVVFPQFPVPTKSLAAWTPLFMRLADLAMRQTAAEFNVDPTRVYETGISQGAYLSWNLPLTNPSRFAALVPIAGGICVSCVTGGVDPADPTPFYQSFAATLHNVPMWFFHGAADASDPVTRTRRVVQVLQQSGAPVQYTEYPSAGHVQSWTMAYADPQLWSWLFAQHTH